MVSDQGNANLINKCDQSTIEKGQKVTLTSVGILFLYHTFTQFWSYLKEILM